jgi:hypothetical protein
MDSDHYSLQCGSMEVTRRDVVVVDVTEGTADSTLEHEAMKASGVVSASDGSLHGVSDEIDHRIHGRYGVHHLLTYETVTSAKSLTSSPVNSLSFLFCILALTVKSERA